MSVHLEYLLPEGGGPNRELSKIVQWRVQWSSTVKTTILLLILRKAGAKNWANEKTRMVFEYEWDCKAWLPATVVDWTR